ncbi:MAG: tetratricopeptide repeat protein [Gemmatimonadales bacterium]
MAKRAGAVALLLLLAAAPAEAQDGHEHGFGHVHMETSCARAVSADFDRALALLHNFWYARALEAFEGVIGRDPRCGPAYWGAAMTYNHPFWDAPTAKDLAAAWARVQEGMRVVPDTGRERMYLEATAALYRDAGAAPKTACDIAYRDAMRALHERYPDENSNLFHGLAILGAIREGTRGFEQQAVAAALFEEVYARNPEHPGVLHYLIHVYDDPAYADSGLPAARAYATAAAAVPHAQHMPSHIFTRLGHWEESAATNENAWSTSEADIQRAGEGGEYRDFHSLNYLQYAYLQQGRFRDALKVTDIIRQQYESLPNKTTAPDSPDLEARHVRGRTIYALPDRVAYGYFDMLARYIVEAGAWQEVAGLPLVAPSRDFVAMQAQVAGMVAAKAGDTARAKSAAETITGLAATADRHPFAQQVIRIQAAEARAVAAQAAGDTAGAIRGMQEAMAIEDSISAPSQPPYPIIPAHELYGTMLLAMGKPAEARKQFEETLRRTPGRPKAVFGIASAAEATGDPKAAAERYAEFLRIWKRADADRPELVVARRFLDAHAAPPAGGD